MISLPLPQTNQDITIQLQLPQHPLASTEITQRETTNNLSREYLLNPEN